MKTGLRLYLKYRKIIAWITLIRFGTRKFFIGFDAANQFIQRVDKISLQLILKKFGATIGNNCDIETGLIFHNCNNYKNLIVGDNCHIGKACFFDLRDRIIIRNNVVISMQCSFITHIDMTKSELSVIYPSNSKFILLNNDCYIGTKSTVLMGVEIAEKSIIGAMSLVNKNIATSGKYYGIPVKKFDF